MTKKNRKRIENKKTNFFVELLPSFVSPEAKKIIF
jgi:hypothetical protein